MNAYEVLARFFSRRRHAYKTTFAGGNSHVVLEDLAKFCRAHISTANADTHMAARLDGRREVWLRIQNHLQLNDEEIWALYTGRPTGPETRISSVDMTGESNG